MNPKSLIQLAEKYEAATQEINRLDEASRSLNKELAALNKTLNRLGVVDLELRPGDTHATDETGKKLHLRRSLMDRLDLIPAMKLQMNGELASLHSDISLAVTDTHNEMLDAARERLREVKVQLTEVLKPIIHDHDKNQVRIQVGNILFVSEAQRWHNLWQSNFQPAGPNRAARYCAAMVEHFKAGNSLREMPAY